MLAIDLCCKAGGAAMGLYRAGFEVIGVDIEPQPRYPFKFVQADALTYPLDGADFVWASPRCQGYTALRHAPGAIGAPQDIDMFRARMPDHTPWVIENVEEAKWAMRDPITLCGSMFGLGAQGCRTQRHRLFESNFPIEQPVCSHDHRPVIGVYGGHARKRAAVHGGRGTKDVWEGGHKTAASEALGIDWMTLGELSEAIPPAYALYIGRAAITYIQEMRRLAA
jgi:DNA (cytosine-5)-methyltransferase 1